MRGAEHRAAASDRMLRKRMKAAMWRLVDEGIVRADLVKDFSMISFRRGGNSVAAAEGVRDRVREEHGR